MQGLFIGSESIDTTLLVLTSKHTQDSDCDDERKQVDLTLDPAYGVFSPGLLLARPSCCGKGGC
jgi:hypothetical protein